MQLLSINSNICLISNKSTQLRLRHGCIKVTFRRESESTLLILSSAWITEGDICCPTILRYLKASPNRPSGAVSHAFTTVMDILPTILDVAGIQYPTAVSDGNFQSRSVLPPRGRSWVPYLLGQADVVHGDDVARGWELFSLGAIR